MFTGIVEEKGIVRSISQNLDGLIVDIQGSLIFNDLNINDSVSCSGICLTVVKIKDNIFSVQMVDETIKRSNAGSWKKGTQINLERALLPTTRLGGHFIQGHIDSIISVIKVYEKDRSAWMRFELENSFEKYIVQKGSIALDGVSLTVAKKNAKDFEVAVIPHTMELTTFGSLKVGCTVNLEVDMMAKYLENLIKR